jgi:hypothetical protein
MDGSESVGRARREFKGWAQGAEKRIATCRTLEDRQRKSPKKMTKEEDRQTRRSPKKIAKEEDRQRGGSPKRSPKKRIAKEDLHLPHTSTSHAR